MTSAAPDPASAPATVRTDRPWGRWEDLRAGPGFKIKLIEVRPGQRLSLQRHQRRSEHWVVVTGRADVEVNGRTLQLAPGEAVDIPLGAWHRLGNRGGEDLVLLELQTGDYCGEDDIERRADDYGRVSNGPMP
jgi:mannose-6-phosphate isomerase